MAHDTPVVTRSAEQQKYYRANTKAYMQRQVTNFAIMIFLTLIAFASVMADFSKNLILPLILLLAGIQVVLQLYAFMHLEDRSTHMVGVIEFFIWSGAFLAFTFFVAFTTIIWWGN